MHEVDLERLLRGFRGSRAAYLNDMATHGEFGDALLSRCSRSRLDQLATLWLPHADACLAIATSLCLGQQVLDEARLVGERSLLVTADDETRLKTQRQRH